MMNTKNGENDALLLANPIEPFDLTRARASFYKSTATVSASKLKTKEEENVQQDIFTRKRSRSKTVSVDMTPSDLNPTMLERRELYVVLPFVSAFGMGRREHTTFDTIRLARYRSLTMTENNKLEQLHSEIDVDEIIITFPMVMAVIVAIITQFLVGYNTSIMNAPASVIFPGHSTVEWSFAVAAFALGGPIGAIVGGSIANERGRRGAILTNSIIFFVGGLLMALAPNIYVLIPGRLIVGIGAGMSSVVVPIYLGEIAPPTMRGTLGTFTQFATVIGILFSVVVAIPLSTSELWRWMFALTPILCALELSVSSFLLESPRWLLGKDRNSELARIIIKKLRGFRNDDDVEYEAENFVCADRKQRTKGTDSASGGAMINLLLNRNIRVLVVSAIFLQMVQQFSGVSAIFYYSTTIFELSMKYPIRGTIFVATMNVLSTYLALKLMDRTPRRLLLLYSTIGALISLLFLIAALQQFLPSIFAVLSVCFFVSFFEIGLGPIPWLIVAEMFDTKYVATAMSMACIVNWTCNSLTGLLFPIMFEKLGPLSFLPFVAILALNIYFTYTYLPETHERTIDEIHLIASGNELPLELVLAQ